MEALSSIGSFITKNIGSIIPGAATGAGFLGNWLNQRKVNERQKFMESLSKDPAKMNQYISGFSKPLNRGLTSGVENEVQAVLGERGLSSSPAITQDVMAQALGPYQQQEQQMAINAAMQSLGMMPQSSGPSADTSMPLFMLMQSLKKPASGGVDMSGVSMGPPDAQLSPGIFNFDTSSSAVPEWGS